jgi:hypothetical protein
MYAGIILGTIRVDLHTTVIAIIVDIEAVSGVDGLHRLVVACEHDEKANSAGDVDVGKKRGLKWGLRRTLTATLSRRLGEHG